MFNNCRFTLIQGDTNVRIGDPPAGLVEWRKKFDAPERDRDKDAILMFMVAGLTAADSDVEVVIHNDSGDHSVGHIQHHNGANRHHWFTQVISIGPNVLTWSDNEIRIKAKEYAGGTPPHDLYDDFFIRDVVCFYTG